MVNETVMLIKEELHDIKKQKIGLIDPENSKSLTFNTSEEKHCSLLHFIFEEDSIFIDNLDIILNKNISDANYKVKDIARDMILSYESLNNKLNRIKNCSIKRYFCRYRMERAKMLLESTSLSISEICYAVGSTNLQSFSRSFKREFGISPRMIRKRNSQK